MSIRRFELVRLAGHHSRWHALVVAGLVMLVPTLAARAQGSAPPAAPSIESGIDPSVRPGDDFFAYANGAWLKATTIPAGRERWGVRQDIEVLTRRNIDSLFAAAATAPAGSLGRKVADYRAAYLAEATIESRGLAGLKPLLDSISALQDKVALTRFLGHSLGTDADPLNLGIYRSARILGLAVELSIHGEQRNVAFLLQGGLGLPDREAYLAADSGAGTLRSTYVQYMTQLLSAAGFDHPDQRAHSVMLLETALAQSQATIDASARDHNADTVWSRAEFSRQAPGMDWPAFFSAAGLAGQDSIVPWQPGAMRGLASLVSSGSLDAWKDYLRFHALDEAADVLPRALADPALAFRAAVAGNQSPPPPRQQRALTATQLALGEAVGRLYAERYFPPAQKARVRAIVANVTAAFARRVETVSWLSPASRMVALAKVKALYVGIGYPERWQDYGDLTIEPNDALGNLRRVADRNYRRTLARLGQPVDLKEWWIPPQSVGGVLIFQQNAYQFAAGLLQDPKYDPSASDAASYGAIGATIAHDVSHFVDVLGAEYALDGSLRRWWTNDDKMRFEVAAAPLVSQFSGYRPFPDLAVDGKLTETENVADLAGLMAAFDAYRATLGSRAADRAYVRQQDREFFIAFARSYRAKLSESALRTQVKGNDHAPEMFRVSTVRNLDAWYDAFDVKPGQRLYLEPGARVRIW